MPMRRRDSIPIGPKSKGLYPLEDAARIMGLTRRRLSDMTRAGWAPKKYEHVLSQLGNGRLSLPVDPPPPADVIGWHAFKAIDAMRNGDYRLAKSIANEAQIPELDDWSTARKQDFTYMQSCFNRAALGMAWARSPEALNTAKGLPSIYALHGEVTSYVVRRPDDRRPPIPAEEGPAWEYLHALTFGYSLAYLVGKLGLGWFATDAERERYNDRARRKRIARVLVGRLGFLQEISEPSVLRRRVTIRVAWNCAQLATLAKAIGEFKWALEAIFESYPDVFEAVVEALNRDVDTKELMTHPLVSKFVDAALKSLKGIGPTHDH